MPQLSKRIKLFPVLLITFILLLCVSIMAHSNPANIQIRAKIISLIEDELSETYSFSEKSTHTMPHFEVLDKIYPRWHQGERANGRNFWVQSNYRAFWVNYRVDYVYIQNGAAAVAQGKKLIYWTEDQDPPDFKKLWPFQVWASMRKRSARANNYLHSMYAMPYSMKLKIIENGDWIIAEESVRNNPQMDNNLKIHCPFEKQLELWGLRNYCDKPSIM